MALSGNLIRMEQHPEYRWATWLWLTVEVALFVIAIRAMFELF